MKSKQKAVAVVAFTAAVFTLLILSYFIAVAVAVGSFWGAAAIAVVFAALLAAFFWAAYRRICEIKEENSDDYRNY